MNHPVRQKEYPQSSLPIWKDDGTKMPVVAIIADYNPFHHGHHNQIVYARETLRAKHVIVAMTGNYTQRGLPAIAAKTTRAQAAVNCGSNAVFEIPPAFATSPLDSFALGAVSLLDALGIVDVVLFGSESGPEHLQLLASLAYAMAQNEKAYAVVRSAMTNSLTREAATLCGLSDYVGAEHIDLCIEALRHPNNLLGILYIYQAIRLKTKLRFATNPRIGQAFFEDTVPKADLESMDESEYGERKNAYSRYPLSATSIRNYVLDSSRTRIQRNCFIESSLPRGSFEALAGDPFFPIAPDAFSEALRHRAAECPDGLRSYFPEDGKLAHTISEKVKNGCSYDETASLCAEWGVAPYKATRILTRFMLCLESLRPSKERCDDGAQWTRLLAQSGDFNPKECPGITVFQSGRLDNMLLLGGLTFPDSRLWRELQLANDADDLFCKYAAIASLRNRGK